MADRLSGSGRFSSVRNASARGSSVIMDQVESVRGWALKLDMDVVLAYQTPQVVIIKDRWLGATRIFSLLLVGVYFLGVPMYTEKAYLKIEPVSGWVDLTLRDPDSFTSLAQLSYCAQLASGSPLTGLAWQKPCVQFPAASVADGSSHGLFFATTRIQHDEFNVSCLEALRGNTSTEACHDVDLEQYVAQPEQYRVAISHGIAPSDTARAMRSADVPGVLVCQSCDGSELEREQASGTDVVKLADLLRASGVVSLDNAGGDKVPFRHSGVTLLLDIRYLHGWLGNVEQYEYHVTKATDSAAITSGATDWLRRAQSTMTPTTRSGLRVLVRQSGFSGKVTLMSFLVAWVSCMTLARASRVGVDLLLAYVMPMREVYRILKWTQSVDFSDLRKGDKKAMRAVQTLRKERRARCARGSSFLPETMPLPFSGSCLEEEPEAMAVRRDLEESQYFFQEEITRLENMLQAGKVRNSEESGFAVGEASVEGAASASEIKAEPCGVESAKEPETAPQGDAAKLHAGAIRRAASSPPLSAFPSGKAADSGLRPPPLDIECVELELQERRDSPRETLSQEHADFTDESVADELRRTQQRSRDALDIYERVSSFEREAGETATTSVEAARGKRGNPQFVLMLPREIRLELDAIADRVEAAETAAKEAAGEVAALRGTLELEAEHVATGQLSACVSIPDILRRQATSGSDLECLAAGQLSTDRLRRHSERLALLEGGLGSLPPRAGFERSAVGPTLEASQTSHAASFDSRAHDFQGLVDSRRTHDSGISCSGVSRSSRDFYRGHVDGQLRPPPVDDGRPQPSPRGSDHSSASRWSRDTYRGPSFRELYPIGSALQWGPKELPSGSSVPFDTAVEMA